MNDVEVLLELFETGNDGSHDILQILLGHAALVYLVDRATVHVLHANVYRAFDEEGAIKRDDAARLAPVQHVELHDDLVQARLVELESDLLHSHEHAIARVKNLLNCAVIAGTQFTNELQLVNTDVELFSRRELDPLRVHTRLAVELETARLDVEILAVVAKKTAVPLRGWYL